MLAGLAVICALGVLTMCVLLAYLSIERASAVDLPTPTGPFAVSRAIYDWRDETAIDPLAPTPGTSREILAWLWHPAVTGSSTTVDDYAPASMLAAAGRPTFPFSFLYRDRSKVHPHSIRNANLPPGESFPVVILTGPAGPGISYTALAEDLASHGYVVVGVDAPYRSDIVVFPDGRVIRRTEQNDLEAYPDQELPRVAPKLLTAWVSDISFALDRLTMLNASDPSGKFTGHLDLTRVGIFGHSFGGAQATQFCHDDSRCRAAIDIDGALFGNVIREGVPKPFMFLISMTGTGLPSDPETHQVAADFKSFYNRLPQRTRWGVFVRGANHFLYSDNGVLASRLVLGALRLFRLVRIDGRRQIAVTAYCVHTFFDSYLREAASPPTFASPLYPELDVSTGAEPFPR